MEWHISAWIQPREIARRSGRNKVPNAGQEFSVNKPEDFRLRICSILQRCAVDIVNEKRSLIAAVGANQTPEDLEALSELLNSTVLAVEDVVRHSKAFAPKRDPVRLSVVKPKE